MLQPWGSTRAPLLQSRYHLPQLTPQFYENKWSRESWLSLQVCKESFFSYIWSPWRVDVGMKYFSPFLLGMVKKLIFRKLWQVRGLEAELSSTSRNELSTTYSIHELPSTDSVLTLMWDKPCGVTCHFYGQDAVVILGYLLSRDHLGV